jgi:putative ABC transport system permease protein
MIAKTLLSTLLRKKERTLLLLFSIAACASLMFANAGFQRTIGAIIYEKSVRYSGNAELYISVKQSVGAEEWIDTKRLAPYAGQFEYAQELIKCKALYAPGSADAQHYFTALGTDMNEFNARNPLTLQSGGIADWTGDRLIMSAAFADRLGVTSGDYLPLEINGEARNFLIAGISQPKGLFSRDIADGGYLLMPRDTLSAILGGQCNLVFIKTKNPSSVDSVMQTLGEVMPQYSVNLGINHAVIQAETNNFVMPFWISSIIVLFMSVFIIYSSFNLIVNERIKILGILRSVGCSRLKTNAILVSESIVIGLAGGAIGCILGIGVLVFIKTMFFSANNDIGEGTIVIGVYEVIFTLITSVIITVLSAMLPVIRVTKMPVKNIILNDYQKQKFKTGKHWLPGIALMAPVVIVPLVIKQGFTAMVLASLAFTIALIGMNLITPALGRLASRIAGSASPEIALGVRNSGDFRDLVNNTRLFGTTIAIITVMVTLFNTLGSDVRNTYKQHQYDIEMKLRESNRQTLLDLSQINGVVSAYGIFQTYGKLTDHGIFMNGLVGINGADYFDFFHANIPVETITALNNLKDNDIVTTYVFRDKLGLKLGDVLTIQVDEGMRTSSSIDYVITGFLDTNWGIGHMGYISAETYKSDFGIKNYTSIAVITNGDPIELKSKILRTYSKDVLMINTKQEQEDANADKIEGIFNAINTYSYFAMLIGFLGIVNNMTACFLGRRRNIAVYRCIGMSKKRTGRMLMTEAVTIGIIGVVTGLVTGILVMGAIPFFVGIFWGNVAVDVPVIKITVICIAGMSAILFCSLIPSVMGKNISVMDTIRYE